MHTEAITHAHWETLDRPEFHEKFEQGLAKALPADSPVSPILIGGELRTSTGPPRTDHSPGDPSIILGAVGEVEPHEIDAAFRAAAQAFGVWGTLQWEERVEAFRLLARLIDHDRFHLAALISFEIGKNRFEAMTEVEEAIRLIEFYADQLEESSGFVHHYPPLGAEESVSVLRPYGVWAVLGPSNFPFALVTGMMTAAAISGNTVIVKPPEDAPLPGLRLGELTLKAGFPPGVINVITGGSEVGKAIVDHDQLAGVAFTGSAPVGQQIIQALVPRGVPVVAEMGGKNAAIVGSSADLSLAVSGIARSAFRYSGQKCSACSRVYVVRDVADELLERLVEEARRTRIGVPWEKGTEVGSLISHASLERYEKSVREATASAQAVFLGQLPCGLPEGGAYAAPAIAAGLPHDHHLMSDELFLPILAVQQVDTFDEAVQRTNATQFGLTSGVYSEDEAELGKFFAEAEAGVLYANRASGATTGAWVGHQSFGGWKRSGATGKNAHGPYYLHLFMREQSRTVAASGSPAALSEE